MLHLNLVCLVGHPSVPAFLPGTTAALSGQAFVMDTTPGVLRRLATAIRDGALHVSTPPPFDEIERAVQAETDALQARIDAYFASRPPQALAG